VYELYATTLLKVIKHDSKIVRSKINFKSVSSDLKKIVCDFQQ